MGVFLSFSVNSALRVLIAGSGGFGRVGSNPGYARAGQEELVIFFGFLILVIGCLVCEPGGDCSVSLAMMHAEQ